MNFKNLIIYGIAALLIVITFSSNEKTPGQKPNIVWIMLEDWGYQLSCYGEKGIQTPNIDKIGDM